MSEHLRPGDMVECVDARPPAWPDAPRLILGALYTIAAVGLAFTRVYGETEAVIRHRVIVDGIDHSWNARRFRKIHRPRADFLTELLEAPVSLPEHEPETA